MTEVDSAPTSPSTMAQRLTAEVIGTFILVLIGCGAALASGLKAGEPGFNGTVGLAFGLAVLISAYAFGRISGGHFNPAVSVGAAISGRIAWAEAGLYAIAQVVGAIVASIVLWIVYHGIDGYQSTRDGLGANGYGDHSAYHVSAWAVLIAEIVLTAVFVFIILAVTDDRNHYQSLAPLAIGLALAAIHFVAIPIDGTSVNPARSLGPALFSGGGAMGDLWVFIIAPLLGAAGAGLLYPALFGRTGDPVPGSGLNLSALGNVGGRAGGVGGVGGVGAPGAVGYPAQPQQQPIIQDGWQWDPATQQWIPAQQQPPAPHVPPAPETTTQALPTEPPAPQDPAPGSWEPPAQGGEQNPPQ